MIRQAYKAMHAYRRKALAQLRVALPHLQARNVAQNLVYEDRSRAYDVGTRDLPLVTQKMLQMWAVERDEKFLKLYEGDVALEGRSGLVLMDGCVVWGSSDYPIRERAPKFLAGLRSMRKKYAELISFHHAFDANYFHFFNNVLLKLHVINEYGLAPNIPIVFSERLARQPFFHQAIDAGVLRDRPFIIHKGNEILESDKIYTVKAFDVDFEATQWMIEPLLENLPQAPINALRLYLMRGKNAPNARHFRNQEALDVLLARYDVQKIDPQDYSLLEQIAFFRHAEFIMSPHGAGLTNLMFCEPHKGAQCFELFNATLGSPHYLMLCEQRGIDYAWCLNLNESGKENVASSEVDLVAVEAQLKSLH